MVKILVVMAALLVHSSVFAHRGGLDEHGCHNTKAGARHCHGESEGKYIPMTEEKRLEKLHRDTCKSLDAEGRKVRVDLYGKKCKAS